MSTKPLLAALLLSTGLGALGATASAQEAPGLGPAPVGPVLATAALAAPATIGDRYGRTPSRGHGRTARIGVRPVVHRAWVPGHYESVKRRVWVPGHTERVWVEPLFEIRYDACGAPFRFQVRAGHYETVHTPGCYETRVVRVWVPGYWASHRR